MTAFKYLRFFFVCLLIRKTDKLRQDLDRWKEIRQMNCSDYRALAVLLWDCREFRNLVLYRHSENPIRRHIIRLFYPPLDSLFLESFEIGGGLYIQHGFSTMVAARSIGKNCWINQQVTVGYSMKGEAPVIGDNVMITCGAKVLGEIHVGNNVIVGANAVVVRDVPDNCVVGGIPARIIRKTGTETKERDGDPQ